MKLCVCLGKDWSQVWVDYAGKADLVELRVDQMFAQSEPATVVAANTSALAVLIAPVCEAAAGKWIFTCRGGFLDEAAQLDLLEKLLPHVPAYIDIACEPLALSPGQQALMAWAKAQGVKLILSFHQFEEVPEIQALYTFSNQAFAHGADLVKIVCHCRDAGEEARLLSLYRDREHAGRIIAFGMGPYGLMSRLHAAALGAPIIYLAPDHSQGTAPGQPCYTQFKNHLVNIF